MTGSVGGYATPNEKGRPERDDPASNNDKDSIRATTARSNPERVKYAEAGALGRYVLRWACHATPDLRAAELQVVMAIVGETALYSKASDTLSLVQIATAANLHPKSVARVLRGFRDRADCPIAYRPGRGKHVYSVVALKREPHTAPLSLVKREPHTAPLSSSHKGTEGASKGNREASKGNRVTGDSVPSELDLPSRSRSSESEVFATTGKPPDLVEALVSVCLHQSDGYRQEAQGIIDRALELFEPERGRSRSHTPEGAMAEVIASVQTWRNKPRFPRAIWQSVMEKAFSLGVSRVPDRWDLPMSDYEQAPRYSAAALAAFEQLEAEHA